MKQWHHLGNPLLSPVLRLSFRYGWRNILVRCSVTTPVKGHSEPLGVLHTEAYLISSAGVLIQCCSILSHQLERFGLWMISSVTNAGEQTV